ncbi:MAG: hypothetical protein A3G77_09195 [Acidobacteria bacterium RIFCSPLOWO2_12_FULL_68_19]|nr:MAG: hypothetical protein A3G77_09195 [Acidobacteria bacterium RIFCSPLOWO2_12_FULL_68_19]
MVPGRGRKIEVTARETRKSVATSFHLGEGTIGLGVLSGASAGVWTRERAAVVESQCPAIDPCRQGVRNPTRANAETRRLSRATEILEDALLVPERSIPRDVLRRARCVAVFPEAVSFAFLGLAAGKLGDGFVSCRAKVGTDWSAPAGIVVGRIIGGGFGRPGKVDLIVFMMNESTVEFMLTDGTVVLGEPSAGVDAEWRRDFRVVRSVPGPLGTDTTLADDGPAADVLAWSVSSGILSGVSIADVLIGHRSEEIPSGFSGLKHSFRRTLPLTSKRTEEVNEKLYGKKLGSREILAESKALPREVGRAFISVLTRYSQSAM